MECSDKEEFKLNAKYENRLRREKVNQIQIVETKQERIVTAKKINTDRQYQIDAAIVRIMKSRKTLIHQQLMAQPTQIPHPPEPSSQCNFLSNTALWGDSIAS